MDCFNCINYQICIVRIKLDEARTEANTRGIIRHENMQDIFNIAEYCTRFEKV